MAPPRSMRSKVAPATFAKKDGHARALAVKHHPPDEAGGGGGYVGTGMAAVYCQQIEPNASPYCQEIEPSAPLPYCQEIKSCVSSRRGVDPPDVSDLSYNRNRRMSNVRASRSGGLAPLKEGSHEGSANSPGRRTNPSPGIRPSQKNAVIPEKDRSNRSCVQYQKGLEKEATHNPVVTNKERKKYTDFEVSIVAYQQRRGLQQKNQPENVAFNNNFDISELSFRGLPDPPDRHQCHKSTKTYVSGPQDPPAEGGGRNKANARRRASQRKSAEDRRVGGRKLGSSITPAETGDKDAGRRRGGQRSSVMPAETGDKDVRRMSGRRRGGGRSGAGGRGRGGRGPGGGGRSSAPSAPTPDGVAPVKKEKERRSNQVKSILKKRECPPPVVFFGGRATHSLDCSSDGAAGDGEGSAGNKTRSASTINYDYSMDSSDQGDVDDGKSVGSSSNSMKSALRRGRFAAAASRGSASFSSSDGSSDASSEGGDPAFDRARSHFLRTADLGLTQDTIFAQQFLDDPNSAPEPHYHHPTPHPPPGVQFNIDENWICVDDGSGGHSPIAPQAVDALVAMGYRTACDPMMWTPTSKTRKYMTEKRLTFESLPVPGPLFEGEGGAIDGNCLLWSGRFRHRYHGSDLPAIRSQGFVNLSAEELVDLLMDSGRVEEYNKASVGRVDEVVLSYGNDDGCPFSGRRKKRLTGVVVQGAAIVDGCATFADDSEADLAEGSQSRKFASSSSSQRRHGTSRFVGVTKLVRSQNKVPLIKKTLQFATLLHCRELLDEQGGNGYIIVGRSVTPADDAEKGGKGVIRSEVLLSVTIVRRLHQSERGASRTVSVGNSGRAASKKDLRGRCLMITMNHVKSPLIPKLIAKRVGLSAATNFMSDIRAARE